MNVALVHEFLITWGGSDFVVQKFGEIYPEAPIFTALFDRGRLGERFEGKNIVTSFLQKFPLALSKHRLFMPLFPLAFESFDLTGYDVVLSSHHMAAKSVLTRSETCHICFVHSPMRYAWDFFPEYMSEFGRLMRIPMRLLFHYLRIHDAVSANRVDFFIANSQNVSRRIMKHYRREAAVIHSPVQCANFHVSDRIEDYYLVVSRLVPYKRVDVAVEAFRNLKQRLVVVGAGPELKRLKNIAGPNVEFAGFVPDERLGEYYSKCKAFLFPGEEDFGITPLEAQASGRPVIAYAAGGALETVIAGKTGAFFKEQTPAALAEAVKSFDPDKTDPAETRRHAEGFDELVFKRKISEFVKEKYGKWKGGEA
jgi:glycosyltransferase involved in cell wall biosynthesis